MSIEVPKKANTAVLAIPHSGTIELYPAGGVFPLEIDDKNELSLTWEDGFLAHILFKLASVGMDIASINVKKLKTEIDARSGGNPWNLDGDQIAERLSSGTFSVYFIDKKPSTNVIIEQVEGGWFSENPVAPLLASDEAQHLSIESLTFGFHRFFSRGSDRIIDIFVDESGWSFVLKRRGAARQGREIYRKINNTLEQTLPKKTA